MRLVLGFSSLTYRPGVLLDRLLPLDLDQGNRISLDLDQTFEVVSEGLYQRLKLVLDRSAIACPLVQPGEDPLKRLPSFDAMVIASVVPRLEAVFRRMAEDYYHLEPLFVSPRLKLNITFDYPQPSEVGTDRICDAVAAFDQFGRLTTSSIALPGTGENTPKSLLQADWRR